MNASAQQMTKASKALKTCHTEFVHIGSAASYRRVCQNAMFGHTLFRCVRKGEMQGVKDESEGAY